MSTFLDLPRTFRLRRKQAIRVLREVRFRRLAFECFEPRQMLAADWQNPGQTRDVNDDLTLSPNDALVQVNALNNGGSRLLPAPGPGGPPPFLDANGDGQITPNDVLLVVNSLNAEVPIIAARLQNDTAPGGASNRDRVTRESLMVGRATDADGITGIQFSLDNGSFQSITLGVNGNFTFDPGLPTNGTADGPHVIRLRATDGRGVTSADLELQFTLDTTGPTTPSLDLDPLFDSPPLGDRTTTFGTVTLAGQTSAAALVELASTGKSTTADAQGHFSFTEIELSAGANTFTVQAFDAAGNETTHNVTINRSGGGPVELTPPRVLAADDTGLKDNDNITRISNPRITLTAEQGSQVKVLLDGATIFDGVSPGTLVVQTNTLADGLHQVSATASNQTGNASTTELIPLVIDTASPVIQDIDLAATSDSGSRGDRTTRFSRVTLAGSTGMRRLFPGTRSTLMISGGRSPRFLWATPTATTRPPPMLNGRPCSSLHPSPNTCRDIAPTVGPPPQFSPNTLATTSHSTRRRWDCRG